MKTLNLSVVLVRLINHGFRLRYATCDKTFKPQNMLKIIEGTEMRSLWMEMERKYYKCSSSLTWVATLTQILSR